MHLSAPEVGFIASSAVVSSIIPVALGAAHAAKMKGEDRVAAVFFGDGATEEGVFWESANFASLMGLPVLFVCEDNGLAIHALRGNRQAYQINEAVAAFGLRVFESRTTDPEEIRTLTLEALAHMRASGKPAFLHLHYHRYLEHVGINEDYCFGYRCKEDAADWYAVDPVARQRGKLLSLGLAEAEIAGLEQSILSRIEGCVERARKAPFAPVCALHEDVFA
jgi:pyruvate dehydrogenase E1 component alpha subunit